MRRMYLLLASVVLALAGAPGLAVAAPPAAPLTPPVSVNRPVPAGAIPMTSYAAAVAKYNASTTPAERAARMASFRPLPAGVLAQPVASGNLPYGGAKYAAFSPVGPQGDGLVRGCSTTIATVSVDGRRFFLSAGHCVKNATGTANVVDPTTGRFWYPYTGNPNNVAPTLGNTGHGGARFDSAGDYVFIRANLLTKPSFAEIGTYDSRGAVAATGWGNPILSEPASCACGQSRRLIHGFVAQVNFSAPLGGHPAPVGNLADLQVNNTTEGCAIPGDSGSTIVRADHQVLGTASAAGVDTDGVTCHIYFNQIQAPMNAANMFMAPSPPA